MTVLESLKKYSVVVADTGDIQAIARLKAPRRNHQPVTAVQRRAAPRVSTPGARRVGSFRKAGQ